MKQTKQSIDDLRPIALRNKVIFELRSRGVKHEDLAKRFKITLIEIDDIFDNHNVDMLEKIARHYDIKV